MTVCAYNSENQDDQKLVVKCFDNQRQKLIVKCIANEFSYIYIYQKCSGFPTFPPFFQIDHPLGRHCVVINIYRTAGQNLTSVMSAQKEKKIFDANKDLKNGRNLHIRPRSTLTKTKAELAIPCLKAVKHIIKKVAVMPFEIGRQKLRINKAKCLFNFQV